MDRAESQLWDFAVAAAHETTGHKAEILEVTRDLALRIYALWKGANGTGIKSSDVSFAVAHKPMMTGVGPRGLTLSLQVVESIKVLL